MKKQHTILALLLVCAVLIANLVPVKADEAVRFTSIKGVDYIQLRENTTDEFGSQTAYNYDLQLLNDGTLNNAYTASQTNPFTTGSLESINAAWSNVTAAYCLEHSLGYPHGTDYKDYTGFDEYFENAFTDEVSRTKAKNGVLNVILNGYPNNREYWSANGVKNYGAQLYATQVAVWYVLTMYGGANNTGVFNGYTNVEDFYRRFIDRPDGITAYARTNPKYEGIEGLIDMLLELKECGMNGELQNDEALLSIEPVGGASEIGADYEAFFIVNTNNSLGNGYSITVENILGEYELYIDGVKTTAIDGAFYSDTSDGRELIRIVFKRAFNASTATNRKNIYVNVKAVSGVSTDNIRCYQTDELTITGVKRQKIMLASFENTYVEDGAALTTPREQLGIRLAKTTAGGTQLLSGAKFGIYAAENVYNHEGSVIISKDTLIEELVTDVNGAASTTKDYPYGIKCYIKELEAPFGYIPSDEIKYVTLTDAGIVVDFENEEQKGDIYIHKLGEKLKGFENGDFVYESQPLAEAKYAISDVNGNILQEITTNDLGEAVATNLPLGKYFIKEIEAPYGYKLDTNVYELELEYDSTVKGNVSKTINLDNERIKVSITINKYASNTGASLSDAEFTVYSNDVAVETLVTNENGVAVSKLDYPLGEYLVCETVAPEKYKLNKNIISFTANDSENVFKFDVKDDPIIGKISLSYNESGEIPKTGDSMNLSTFIVIGAIMVILLLMLKRKKIATLMLVAGLMLINPFKVAASENNENLHVIETVYYNSYMQLNDVPEYIEVERKGIKANIPHAKTECINSYWKDDFSFELSFSRNDAAYYELGDKKISTLDDLYLYKDYILSLLELDNSFYQIDSFEWKEGANRLVAVAKGRRLLSDFLVTYEGDLALNVLEDNEAYGTVVLNKVTDEATQAIEQVKTSNEMPLIIGGLAVLIFLLIFFIIHMLHKKRRYCILNGSCV
ncbi:MAG: Cys-Gln thioester bond-forming surface protein [Lachnospiraceae bacterium]|nr:Cys-Gln thioester bond-forming surface protein [Lachnospiraceae bacterium]